MSPSIGVLVDGTSVFSFAAVTPVEAAGSYTKPYYSVTAPYGTILAAQLYVFYGSLHKVRLYEIRLKGNLLLHD